MLRHEQWQVRSSAAELYERYAVRYLLGPWAPGLVELAAIAPRERVLDLACGTGVVARLAATKVDKFGRVTGLDLNAGMLAVARSLPAPLGRPITWVEGSAVSLPFLAASFDVIVCQQGLQFLPDKLAALREMHRVLVPGGRVLLSVWKSAGPYNLAVGDALEQHVDVQTATRYRTSRMVPNSEELHRFLVDAGFQTVQIRTQVMTIRLPAPEAFVLAHLAGTPVAAAISALGEQKRAALGRQVGLALQPYAEGEGVAVPDETHIAMAHT